MRSIVWPGSLLVLASLDACSSTPPFAPDELAGVARFDAAVRREFGRDETGLFADQLLFELPLDWRIHSLDVHGRTGTGFANGESVIVRFDGTLHGDPWHGSIPVPDPTSGEPTRLVFTADDDREALACAGELLGGFDAIHRYLVAETGVTLIGTRRGSGCVIVDGTVRDGSWFDPRFRPVLSPDGSHVAYAASSLFRLRAVIAPLDTPDHAVALQHDGSIDWPVVVLTGGEWIGQLSIGDTAAVHHRGATIGPFDEVRGPVEWSDNDVVVWAVERDGKHGYVVDGQPTAWFESASWSALSADGRHFAFVAREGAVDHVVLDGEIVMTAPKLHALAVADTGAWGVASTDPVSGAVTVHFGDRTFGPFEPIDSLRIDPTGTTMLIRDTRAEPNRWWLGDEPLGSGYERVEDVSLLDDGSGAVFVGHDAAGAHLVTPAATSDAFDWISGRRVSADGTRIAFVAGRDREVWRRVTRVRP